MNTYISVYFYSVTYVRRELSETVGKCYLNNTCSGTLGLMTSGIDTILVPFALEHPDFENKVMVKFGSPVFEGSTHIASESLLLNVIDTQADVIHQMAVIEWPVFALYLLWLLLLWLLLKTGIKCIFRLKRRARSCMAKMSNKLLWPLVRVYLGQVNFNSNVTVHHYLSILVLLHLVAYFFLTTVFSVSFSTQLLSGRRELRIDNIQDAIDSKLTIRIWKSEPILSTLKRATTNPNKELWHILSVQNNLSVSTIERDGMTMSQVLQDVKERKTVIFGPDFYENTLLRPIYCSSHKAGTFNGLHVSSESYSKTMYSMVFALQVNDEVYRRLRRALVQLFESHLAFKLYSGENAFEVDETAEYLSCMNPEKSDTLVKPLAFINIQMLNRAMLSSLAFSFGVLICEQIYHCFCPSYCKCVKLKRSLVRGKKSNAKTRLFYHRRQVINFSQTPVTYVPRHVKLRTCRRIFPHSIY